MMMETVPSGTILHGRYRIERVLGSGGFGHVYLAVDLQKNNQPYAVKEYFVTGSSGQAQLQHEARVLTQLDHPNLPAFQEAFNERGHYFSVFSYIEGSDLTDLIRAARQKNEAIPLTRVLDWILEVCAAVQFLHTQPSPVIHRDIKPDNIRIMPNSTAILVDLGNAKATADGARTLFFIRHQGTPGYAPQEQYPGGTGTDTRSDVYALGAHHYKKNWLRIHLKRVLILPTVNFVLVGQNLLAQSTVTFAIWHSWVHSHLNCWISSIALSSEPWQ